MEGRGNHEMARILWGDRNIMEKQGYYGRTNILREEGDIMG